MVAYICNLSVGNVEIERSLGTPGQASLAYLASSRLGTHTTSRSQTPQVTLWPLCACAPVAALACVFAMAVLCWSHALVGKVFP